MIVSNVCTSSAIAVETRSSIAPSSLPSFSARERRASSRQTTPSASWSFR
jgi:hypothetical protein